MHIFIQLNLTLCRRDGGLLKFSHSQNIPPSHQDDYAGWHHDKVQGEGDKCCRIGGQGLLRGEFGYSLAPWPNQPVARGQAVQEAEDDKSDEFGLLVFEIFGLPLHQKGDILKNMTDRQTERRTDRRTDRQTDR